MIAEAEYLQDNNIYCGDARSLLKRIRAESVALSFWSPPYFVGKSYEKDLSFEEWQTLLRDVIRLHFAIVKPGGFLAVNIADILAFPDPDMPRIQDEFEYIYIFWKPGITTIDRSRLDKEQWSEWGSRAVWNIPSVRANVEHEAQFPIELPRRVIRLLSAPGDLTLDCFIGSGTTAEAAASEGRRYLGMDSDIRYVKMSRERLMQIRMSMT